MALLLGSPSDRLFAAVLGLHSSGSSCLAGVLHHLGLHLGNRLSGFYGSDPKADCGFEAVGLAQICEEAIPFPATSLRVKPRRLLRSLQAWIDARRDEAAERHTIAVGKYPQLCAMGDELLSICGTQLRVVHSSRRLEESVLSIQRRCPKHDPAALRAHQEWLWQSKERLLARLPQEHVLTIEYDGLLVDPEREIERAVAFFRLCPAAERIERARKQVKPEKRHVLRTMPAEL
jgi:hypothetical protein